eukprot:2939561-Prymnesium_polylepis.1
MARGTGSPRRAGEVLCLQASLPGGWGAEQAGCVEMQQLRCASAQWEWVDGYGWVAPMTREDLGMCLPGLGSQGRVLWG